MSNILISKLKLLLYKQDSRFSFRFDGQNFDKNGPIGSSSHIHRQAGLGNYKGKGFTVGCRKAQDTSWICGDKAEVFDLATLTWSGAPNFHYHS